MKSLEDIADQHIRPSAARTPTPLDAGGRKASGTFAGGTTTPGSFKLQGDGGYSPSSGWVAMIPSDEVVADATDEEIFGNKELVLCPVCNASLYLKKYSE